MQSKTLSQKYLRLLWTITKFGLVGLSSVAVYFVLLALLRPVIPSTILLTATAYVGSAVFNFIFQSRVTFKTNDYSKSTLLKYIIMHIICMGINSSVMYLMVDITQINIWISQIFTTSIVAGVSFILSYRWVYKTSKGQAA